MFFQEFYTILQLNYLIHKFRSSFDILKQWVLPSVKGDLGHLKNEETPPTAQMLKMNNERFSIPELLFHPIHIGLL